MKKFVYGIVALVLLTLIFLASRRLLVKPEISAEKFYHGTYAAVRNPYESLSIDTIDNEYIYYPTYHDAPSFYKGKLEVKDDKVYLVDGHYKDYVFEEKDDKYYLSLANDTTEFNKLSSVPTITNGADKEE